MEKFFNQLYFELETRLIDAVLTAVQNKIQVETKSNQEEEFGEWMDLATAAKYLDVSPGTLKNYRLKGLKVTEICNTKRVSKTDIDRFMKKHAK